MTIQTKIICDGCKEEINVNIGAKFTVSTIVFDMKLIIFFALFNA